MLVVRTQLESIWHFNCWQVGLLEKQKICSADIYSNKNSKRRWSQVILLHCDKTDSGNSGHCRPSRFFKN